MNRLQLAALLIGLTGGALGGLLPGDQGYQYDRPAFGSDFGRREPGSGLGRFPGSAGGRPQQAYGPPTTSGAFGGFGRQPGSGGGFGYQGGGQLGGYQGYQQGGQGYQGYQPGSQGYQGFQGTGQGYQGFPGSGRGAGSVGGAGFQGFDGADGRQQGPTRPYSFQYEVRDPASGNDYGQQEAGDANGAVRGEYRVLLPDSRTQIVRYTADDANGYVADVQYEGQPQYPRPGDIGGIGGIGRVGGFGGPGGGGIGGGGGRFFNGGVGGGYQPGRGVGGVGGGYNSGASAVDGFGGVGVGGRGVGGGVGGGGYAGNQYLPPSVGSYGK